MIEGHERWIGEMQRVRVAGPLAGVSDDAEVSDD
jgi:hypothetical protein